MTELIQSSDARLSAKAFLELDRGQRQRVAVVDRRDALRIQNKGAEGAPYAAVGPASPPDPGRDFSNAAEVWLAGAPWPFNQTLKQFPGCPISPDVAEHLPFSNLDAPQAGHFYVCHPLADVYIPLGPFHASVFDEKWREAVILLRDLGAKQVEIEALEGYGFESEARLNISLAELKGRLDMSRSNSRRVVARYPGSPSPLLDPSSEPSRYRWYPHEPDWQQLYESRMTHGLLEQELEVEYQHDFNVTANLAATVKKLKLGTGGEFKSFTKTRWRIRAVFPDAS